MGYMTGEVVVFWNLFGMAVRRWLPQFGRDPMLSNVYCLADGRHTAVQTGGVLLGIPFLQGRHSNTNGGHNAVQTGVVLQSFLDKSRKCT